MPHFRNYQINELVSASHRDQIDLRAYRRALELALQAVFGFDLQRVVVKRRFGIPPIFRGAQERSTALACRVRGFIRRLSSRAR